MKFEGWIPNATGNLSFGSIGGPLIERVHVRQHLRINAKRWVLIAQTRLNRDRLLPRWALPTLGLGLPRGSRRLDATYTMLAVSIPIGSDPEGALDGTLSCLVRPMERSEIALRKASRYGVARRVWLVATEAQPEIHSNLRSRPQARMDVSGELTLPPQRQRLCTCKFRMLRSGKVFFRKSSRVRALSGNGDISAATSISSTIFWKDAVHSHYHHDGSSQME